MSTENLLKKQIPKHCLSLEKGHPRREPRQMGTLITQSARQPFIPRLPPPTVEHQNDWQMDVSVSLVI